MNAERAREILGDLAVDRSDEEMEIFLVDSKTFINTILNHTEKEEGQKICNKCNF